MITYQDLESAADRGAFLTDAVQRYRLSPFFRRGLDALRYFHSENPTVAGKTVLRADSISIRDSDGVAHRRGVTRDVVGNRVGSGFFFRFVCQQNQYLLQNGVQLPPALKQRLGPGFDRALSVMGEHALIAGVCYAFFNADHVQVLPAVRDALSGCMLLRDECTGQGRAAVQFWQLGPSRPQYLRLFEEDGVTLYRKDRRGLRCIEAKQPYLRVGERGANWTSLPVIPLLANPEGRSELTPAIRAKIDCYDRILSDFADNLDRANDVYWVLNNFGGTSEDIAATLAEINRLKAVATWSDGSGSPSTAEPKTISVPYEARTAALELLRKALYEDFMALDYSRLSGSSLTNVAIRAARADLDLKTDRFEWQVFTFVRELLALTGVDTEDIRFQRQTIANESELISAIYTMRGDIDRATALRLNPLLQPEEAEGLVKADG